MATAISHLIVEHAAQAIEFYRRAFDARERMRLTDSEESIVYADVRIGESVLALADETPGSNPCS